MSATDPIAPEPRRFPIRPPVWVWLLAAAAALVIAGIGLSISVPYHEEQQRNQKLEELSRSFGPGAEDPDPDWLRRVEQINESQDALHRIREETDILQEALPD